MTHESWIAIAQLDAGTKEGKVFLSAAFDPESLLKEAVAVESIAWDEKNGTLIARKEWRIGSLVAKEENLRNPAPEKVAGAVCGFISKEGLHLFDRTDASDRLQARVQSLRRWRPEEDFPDFSDEALQESAAVWASPYLGNIRRKEEIKRLDFYAILCGTLSWEQQQVLERLAPTRMEVPSGSMIDIRYSADGSPPVLAVRLQEVFGMTESPTVNGGRTNLLLHLLSPGFKPVQVTQDLKSFWQNTYHEVRKELRIRYPKHSWPEDPWTATAVRGAVRRKQ
jgi:ATP-dependent helicase HrpB